MTHLSAQPIPKVKTVSTLSFTAKLSFALQNYISDLAIVINLLSKPEQVALDTAMAANGKAMVHWQMEGHSTVSSYVVAKGAQKVIDFMVEVLDAHQLYKQTNDDDATIKHASLRIGDTVVMITDGREEFPSCPAWLHVYVPDVDTTYALALDKGAESVMAPSDQVYGDRMSGVKDSAGNTWWLATHKFNPRDCTGDAQVAE